MKSKGILVDRFYKCLSCHGMVVYTEPAQKPFRKKCPLCNKRKLILNHADCGISVFFDLSKPKTIGSLGEKNYAEAKKNGLLPKDATRDAPSWRKNKNKINYKILKNPDWYIKTGQS